MPPSPAERGARGKPGAHRDMTGVFKRAARGYGFVRPEGAEPSDRTGDVFIPQRACLDAASGDLVRVRLDPSGRSRSGRTEAGDAGRPGPSGRILEVVERRTTRFVGTYFEAASAGWVRIDGTAFARPVWVGDPGARGVRENDKVVVEMVRFPAPDREGEGVVVEVLGAAGDPGIDTLTVIREFDLPGPFPEAVLADARRRAEAFDGAVGTDRVDLTGETVITIDPVDARDFDDAISLSRIERDHWLLGVHIADVAHFVAEDSPLDVEARARGTSVYLPDRVIPMLPEIVSNSLASLQPDRVRYARTCWIEFSPEGIPVDARVEKSAIRSVRRFTYEEVDGFLADPDTTAVEMTRPVRRLLGLMRDLARLLRGRRQARGMLELTLPEVRIALDRSGRVSGAHVEENTESHRIIEEFMLSANEAVAAILAAARVPFLRRIHPAPDPRKLRQLTEFVSELGFEVDSLESRFELQRLLGLARGRPEEHAVHYASLRSLARAVYGPAEEGHYALASDCYCHFTSPIRRYPDLTIHRLIDLVLAGRRPPGDGLRELGEHCSELERRAESAERELVKLKLLIFLSSRIGLEMDGVVTGVEPYGLFVQGLDLPAEGLLAAESLPDDIYRYERAGHLLAGRRKGNVFRLGDRLRVVVETVDLDRRTLDLRLAGGKPASRPSSKRPGRSPGRGGRAAPAASRGSAAQRAGGRGSSRRGRKG
jgi:ribonuclease R